MFSKLSALIHQAAEYSSQILTADTTSHGEFREHWKAITDAITENGSITELKERFDAMLELLCLEEEQVNPNDPGTVGPCLEFVLRHKLLDTLFTAAKNDYPAGMSQLILNFFSFLLDRLERPLLHHVSIHQPVLCQVNCCGENPSGPLAADQIQFIQTLCIRLTRDPRLADFFMREDKKKKEFVLLEALLRLINTSDNLVMIKSYECLLTCASLQNLSVTLALATSHLPVLLASKLQYHFQLIPPATNYTAILSCRSTWELDSSATSDQSSMECLRHVEALFFWLDYCERIIAVSQSPLGKTLCENIREVFLSASLLPKLFRTKEEEILISTSVLTCAIRVINNRMLLEEFVQFTLKASYRLVMGEQGDHSALVNMCTLLVDKLICRIDHINEDVCQVTLRLFDVLLSSPFHVVIEYLANCQSIDQHCILPAEGMRLVRLRLEEDTISYLSLIPDSLSSCNKSVSGEYFNQYLREAHIKVARRQDRCRSYPCSVLHLEAYEPASSTANQFLTMLLNKLEALLDQPYETNLLVTSLLCQLATAPYPALRWFFQAYSQERNVYTILKKVSATFCMHMERTPSLVVHIVEARRRLEGQHTSDLLSMPHNNLMEGAVVFEEFVKELCSIIYAKTSWSIISLPVS